MHGMKSSYNFSKNKTTPTLLFSTNLRPNRRKPANGLTHESTPTQQKQIGNVMILYYGRLYLMVAVPHTTFLFYTSCRTPHLISSVSLPPSSLLRRVLYVRHSANTFIE